MLGVAVVGIYSAAFIPALAGKKIEGSIGPPMLLLSILFVTFLWQRRGRKAWKGAVVGGVFGLFAFLCAGFLAGYMKSPGGSEEEILSPVQIAVRERVAAEKARREAMTPEERAAEDQAKADAKAAAEVEKQKEREQAAADREEKAKLQQAADRRSSARGACIVALNRTLHDPSSADLDMPSSWYVEERKDGTILVQPKGRAKNAFGAYIYGTWNCVVKPEGEMVNVLSLKQIRP